MQSMKSGMTYPYRAPGSPLRVFETARTDDVVPRLASESIARAMRANPVVVLMGARQTGKSTLVQEFASRQARRWFTLDSPSDRDALRAHPMSLLTTSEPLVIDEIQRDPDLILALKRAVDSMGTRRRKGHFLVTGSSNPLTMKQVADSLAGRASYVELHPLTRRELSGDGHAGMWSELFDERVGRWPALLEDAGGTAEDWRSRARVGGFPVPALGLTDHESRYAWFRGYEAMYLDRDLRDLAAIQNLPAFRQLVRMLCLRTGNLLNQSDVGRDAALSQPQVTRWLALLETSFQCIRLPAWATNRTSRLIKAPKIYWLDTGLAMFLAGETEPRGAHLENLVLGDLLAWRSAQLRHAGVYFWRSASGREVDFIVERDGRLLAVEVKASSQLRQKDAAHLRAFLDEFRPDAIGGILLYTGKETVDLGDNIVATPWWRVI